MRILILLLTLVSCRQQGETVFGGLLATKDFEKTEKVCLDCEKETEWITDIDTSQLRKTIDSVEYIVIHSTSVDADAEDVNASMGCRKASWHWTVDQSKIIQAIPVSYQAWHCGHKNPLIPCYNSNSLSIEMCQSDEQDPDKVVTNTLMLLEVLKICYPNAKLVRHFDVTGKACPLLIDEKSFNKMLYQWNGSNIETDFDKARMKKLEELEGTVWEAVWK